MWHPRRFVSFRGGTALLVGNNRLCGHCLGRTVFARFISGAEYGILLDGTSRLDTKILSTNI